jgi:hypothetical protein
MKTNKMKKLSLALSVFILIMATSCSNNSNKNKNGVDSVAATDHPKSTDTLRLNSDTIKH